MVYSKPGSSIWSLESCIKMSIKEAFLSKLRWLERFFLTRILDVWNETEEWVWMTKTCLSNRRFYREPKLAEDKMSWPDLPAPTMLTCTHAVNVKTSRVSISKGDRPFSLAVKSGIYVSFLFLIRNGWILSCLWNRTRIGALCYWLLTIRLTTTN